MKKQLILSFAFMLVNLATFAQKKSEVDMSQHGLPFTWTVPVAKPELLKVRVLPASSEKGNTVYTIETADKSFSIKIYQAPVKLGSTPEEKTKQSKASEKKSKVHTFVKFHTDEPALYVSEFQETGGTTSLYYLATFMEHDGKQYDVFSNNKTGKFSEAEIKVMLEAVKSIKWKE